jgi:hypothetical protein
MGGVRRELDSIFTHGIRCFIPRLPLEIVSIVFTCTLALSILKLLPILVHCFL